MKPEERKLLKEKIEQEISKLSEGMSELKELVKPISPENAIGRISRMDAINNKSVNEAALRKASIRYDDLKQALSRIKHPEFGICARCQEIIPMGRMLLRPQSKSCVNCAH
ncbi:MAG: TraR/DksA C4-type zinc finger protein [Flavobacteriales bacterium]|nr:TraR/DksA C4-type zinc finger protein [Flavobacteriales bacterium]